MIGTCSDVRDVFSLRTVVLISGLVNFGLSPDDIADLQYHDVGRIILDSLIEIIAADELRDSTRWKNAKIVNFLLRSCSDLL